jgi:hypothetical protein
MVASVAMQALKEDLASISALVGDLVGAGEAEAMVEKTWYFGDSLIMERMIFLLAEPSLRWQGRRSLRLVRVMQWCSGTTSVAAFACPPLSFCVRFLKNFNCRSTT